MTKGILLLLLCLSLLVLTGCSEESLSDLATTLKDAGAALLSQEPAAPRLIPVDSTMENLTLLDALGQNRKHDDRLFDFIAPAGTQHIVITNWEWKDGQWVTPGGGSKLLLPELQGRLGLSWDRLCDAVNIVLRTREQTFAVARSVPDRESPTGKQTVTIFQSMTVDVVPEKEIPLVMQIVTNADEPPVIPLECWAEPERYAGHVDVRLVTVRFSTEPMESDFVPQP